MDATDQRYAYRCLPLSIANASGWEILCAGRLRGDLARHRRAATRSPSARARTPARARRLATSHFGHGILTLHTGYLFRTSPGWALWARGAPNTAKRNLAPLEGVVETDWLDFPFTMNWRFTRAGHRRLREGRALLLHHPGAARGASTGSSRRCGRSTPTRSSRPPTRRARAAGRDFNAGLAARDPETVARGWQRHYMRGEDAAGRRAEFHLTKRRVRAVRAAETER